MQFCNSCKNYSCTCPNLKMGTDTGDCFECIDGESCVQIYMSDCILYTGPDLPCYGITSGMNVTQLIQILTNQIPACTTTSTTTTTTSSTTTTTSPGP